MILVQALAAGIIEGVGLGVGVAVVVLIAWRRYRRYAAGGRG